MLNDVQAPPEIISALREVDPKADLVHVPGGFWLLGVRGPNPPAARALAEELKADPHGANKRRLETEEKGLSSELRSPVTGMRLELLAFYASGFKPIQMYECERPSWAIVKDFRKRDYNWRVRPDAAVAEMKDAISIDAGNRRRTAALVEYLQQEMGFIYHHVMRRAKRFVQRAIPGGGAA